MNPSKAAVFRLQRNHKDVTTDEYADNLMAYLDTARSCKNITMTHLNNILFGIASHVAPLDFSISGRSEEETNFMVGDHIAAFWLTEEYQWHLGIIDTVVDDAKIKVSYILRVESTNDHVWVFPEEADVHDTSVDQIMCKNIKVDYLNSIRIKCRVRDDNLIPALQMKISDLNNNI